MARKEKGFLQKVNDTYMNFSRIQQNCIMHLDTENQVPKPSQEAGLSVNIFATVNGQKHIYLPC